MNYFHFSQLSVIYALCIFLLGDIELGYAKNNIRSDMVINCSWTLFEKLWTVAFYFCSKILIQDFYKFFKLFFTKELSEMLQIYIFTNTEI